MVTIDPSSRRRAKQLESTNALPDVKHSLLEEGIALLAMPAPIASERRA